jgi:Uma2 family endonuclease
MAANRVTTKKKPATRRPRFGNMGELLAALGGIPPERVCYDPPPGKATKRDLLRVIARTGRLYELVDRTLVEKPMGRPEAYLALELGFAIRTFLATHDLGFCTGADDLVEVLRGQVRGPDLTFTRWDAAPGHPLDDRQISRVIPALAVEVLSPSNTPAEIARKLGEYFRAGVRLVWVIDHRKRTADIHTAPDVKTTLDDSRTLDGGDVLPGFRLPLARLFDRPKPPKRKRK